jgi:tetratricopeptide (TPR) repeat protein
VKTTVQRERIIFCLLILSLLWVVTATAATLDSTKVDQLIAQGNVYAEKTFENQKALQSYQAAIALEPNNYEALWRISRAYVDIGEHLPAATEQEKTQQLQTYDKALEFAIKAIAANANGAMGYTRRAIANGRIALFKGVWESLDLVKQTKADCEKALALDAKEPAAYYVLGRTHMKVSEKPRIVRWPLGLGWANLDEAVKNFEKAIALRPDFIMYRLDCARAYVEQDEYTKARDHLTVITTLPTMDEDDGQFRKEAQELQDKIKGK